jgi:multidrug transporter EmrE-like cation transporter
MQLVTYIAATILLTVYGQLVIKHRATIHARSGEELADKLGYLMHLFLDPWVWSGLLAAVLAAVCWMLVMSRASLATAYPFVALTFVLVPVASTLLFGDRLTTLKLFGLALIVTGIAISAQSD